MNTRNILKLDYPASWWGGRWREALPSGNGSIGAAVYGGVYEETILINHKDLWWKEITENLPDVSEKLPIMRHMLLENKIREAQMVISNELKARGYCPRIGYPLPLGDIKVIMPTSEAFKDYNRILNMETGEVCVNWRSGDTEYKRLLFVSRSENMIVYEIKKEGIGVLSATIYLDLHDRSDVRVPFNGPDAVLPEKLEIKVKDEYIFYSAQNDDGTDFGAVARIIAYKGSIENDFVKIKVSDADKVLVLVKVFVNGDRVQEWCKLKKELEAVEMSYKELLENHIKIHAELYNSVIFDIGAQERGLSNEELLLRAYKGEAPDALIEKMWSYGRYLLISSSREGGNPCPLMGLWCGEYEGFWAFNMINENLQMIYWQVLSGNMPELLLPVFDYFERRIDDFRTNAKNIYGCRGIFIPADTTPKSGIIKDLQPHIIHWTGGAGWIAQHYYDYYLYTKDEEFLKNRAIPFLRDVALFYEDFFIEDENGYFISCPSNSPENTPGNYLREVEFNEGGVYNIAVTINSTMDFAIAKEVFSHLIEGSKILGINNEDIKKWNMFLDKIPPYEINEDGAVKEWMHSYFQDNYHHRHQSHIYPVFPGSEVTADNNPMLFEAFALAVKKRLIIGLKEQSGWALAHMANNYARMGEGDKALECLDILSRSCLINNFFTCHNDWRKMGIGVDLEWAPFQIDANMGVTSSVQEMVLFSAPGKINILPALPAKWRKGNVGPLLARNKIEVMISWDINEGYIKAEVKALNSDEITDISILNKCFRQRVKLIKGVPSILNFCF